MGLSAHICNESLDIILDFESMGSERSMFEIKSGYVLL